MHSLNRSFFPGISHNDVYEYLLIAQPDAEVNNKILQEKKAFYDRYDEVIATKTQPHITVANFLARENMEDTIIRYIQRICSRQSSFEVILNNYSGFPCHTIFLRVQNKQPFKHMANELAVVNNYIRSSFCPPLRSISNFHVSIARRLPEKVYLKALLDLGQKSFYETFTVKELVLLRRTNQYDKCKPVNIFGLQPADKIFN